MAHGVGGGKSQHLTENTSNCMHMWEKTG